MGSSGSSNYNGPNIPAPPSGMISGQGQTAPFNPQYTNFLPSDPSAMATGLTPEMLGSINNGGRPPGAVPAPTGPGAGGGFGYAQMLDMLGQMQGGAPRDPVQAYQQAMRQRQGGGMPQFNIPKPPSGPNGVNPADLAAYQKAQAAQNQQRDMLAEQMARQRKRERSNRGGNR